MKQMSKRKQKQLSKLRRKVAEWRPGNGIKCPRCGERTQQRRHATITAKLLAQPFYYQRWFVCTFPYCKTSTILRNEDRVFAADEVDSEFDMRMAMIGEQLRPSGTITSS
jgi:hypothetical protein